MQFLLPSSPLSLLPFIAFFQISFPALGGQENTVGGLLLTVLEVKICTHGLTL